MKQRSKKGTRRSSNSSRRGGGTAQPPAFSPTTTITRVMRYVCSTAGNYPIDVTSLVRTISIENGASGAYAISSAVKLNSISIWSNANVAGGSTVNSVGVQWLSEYGQTRLVSDTGVGATRIARLHTKPPAQSLASFWRSSVLNPTTDLCIMQLPVGAVVDLSISYTLQNQFLTATDGEAVLVYAITATGVAGRVLYPGLDRPYNAVSKLVPVDLFTED